MADLLETFRSLLYDEPLDLDADQRVTLLKNFVGNITHDYERPDHLLDPRELQQRYRWAIEIQDRIRLGDPEYLMGKDHLSVILVGSGFGELLAHQHTNRLNLLLKLSQTVLMASYYGKPTSQSTLQSVETSLRYTGYTLRATITGNNDKYGRGDDGKTPASARDQYACVVTGTADPEMAHIFPHAATNTELAVEQLRLVWEGSKFLVNDQFYNGRLAMVKARGFEIISNYLALGHQLHWWLDRGYWAFKPIRVECTKQGQPEGWKTALQFYYIPENVNLSTMEDLKQDLTEKHAQGFPARQSAVGRGFIGAHLATGELVRSGHMFYLTHPNKEDAETCYDLFALHWAAVRVQMFRS